MPSDDVCGNPTVEVRPFPYPYRAMLAICSDLDETSDRQVYREIMRFLNTTESTAMGPGVGLEVGNSIYFDMAPGQFAYWNTDDAGRQMVLDLIRSGHIDCLHSYGDWAETRRHAAQALDELARHDCRLEVWVDHGTAATNFDPLIMHGHGDERGHAAYHADITTQFGIQYVWRGRVTSITGQDVPAQSMDIFRWRHPIASSRTLLKETAKRGLARTRHVKYLMHGSNQTLHPTTLRDGHPVYEFMRCNPHWGGVSSCDQGRHIGDVLTDEFMKCLVERSGTCVLYTHLGKVDDARRPFNHSAVDAFRRLAREFQAGRILVTTTRRLLGFRRALREIVFESRDEGGALSIHIQTPDTRSTARALSAKDLSGVTFHVPRARAVRIVVNGQRATVVEHPASSETDRPSVSIPWSKLEFPPL
jgi:hypothetical protein